MWYSKQLRQVRRARKSARAQQHKLLEMELEGIVAITLHSVTQSLTVATEREAGVQVIDLLGQALRERRQVLKTEARDLLENWEESERLHVRKVQPLSKPSSTSEDSAS
jgi:hypothetical protein